MAKAKKWVKFRGNDLVPASVLGTKDDVRMNAGDPVQLPADYAAHVIDLKIAESCAAPKKGSAKKDTDATALTTAQAAVDAAKTELEKAEGDEAKTTAQTRLNEAEADLKKLKG